MINIMQVNIDRRKHIFENFVHKWIIMVKNWEVDVLSHRLKETNKENHFFAWVATICLLFFFSLFFRFFLNKVN